MTEVIRRDFDIEVQDDSGAWTRVQAVRNNHQRMVNVPLDAVTRGVRFVVRASWGAERVHVFAFDVRQTLPPRRVLETSQGGKAQME